MHTVSTPRHLSRPSTEDIHCRPRAVLHRLESLTDKIYQGEYSPKNIPLVAEPTIDPKMVFRVAICASLFMLGSQLKHDSEQGLTVVKHVWFITLFSYFYMFPPKKAHNLQNQFCSFFILRFLSSSIVYSLVTGHTLSYEIHLESQEHDALVNIFLTIVVALFIQREISAVKKYLLVQLVGYISVMGGLQIWYSKFDYVALLHQIALLISLATFCQLLFSKFLIDKDLIQAAVIKRYDEISQELKEIKSKLEEENLEDQMADILNTSKVDEIVMKIKYLKFNLQQKINEKSFIASRPIFSNPRRRTLTGKMVENSSYVHTPERTLDSLGSFSSLADLRTNSTITTPNSRGDINANLTLTPEDCDNLVKLILEKQAVMWYPEVIQANDDKVYKETAEFLKQHFTEAGDNLLNRNPAIQRTQSINLQNDIFQTYSPWSGYLESNICSWNFDMLKFKELTNGNHMSEFGNAVFKKFNILKILNTNANISANFLRDVTDSYLPNPYHNSIHGADVANAVSYFLTHPVFADNFNELEATCLIISALVHDIGHPGLNNAFLVATRSTEALLYNDQSVLENFHTTSFFKILQKPESNILQNLDEKDWKYFRKLSINLILDTDLTKHFIILSKFKNNLEQMCFSEESDRFLALSIALKCADVSHGAKELNLHKRWSRRITEEFFLQGDKEKEFNIPVTPSCDRNGNISKGQQGFLNYIVLPLFEALDQKLFNEEMRLTVTQQIRTNLTYWTDEIPKEELGEKNFIKETERVMEDITSEAKTGK